MGRALSWLVIENDIDKTVKCLVKRTLCYGIRRNFELCKIVLNDVVEILNSGVVGSVRCLLDAVQWCNFSDCKIISDCFIVPVLLWIQNRDDAWLEKLGKSVIKVKNEVKIEDLGLAIDTTVGEDSESSEDSENSKVDSEDSEMDYDTILEEIEKYKAYL